MYWREWGGAEVNGDSERVRGIEVKGKEKEMEHVKDEEETMRRAKGRKEWRKRGRG